MTWTDEARRASALARRGIKLNPKTPKQNKGLFQRKPFINPPGQKRKTWKQRNTDVLRTMKTSTVRGEVKRLKSKYPKPSKYVKRNIKRWERILRIKESIGAK